ncbi:MAG TPA: signal peptidase I [Pyrinomonadaceae bacterium]|nr:signal peptidase I [Pyrinomonadaceae bacterium]
MRKKFLIVCLALVVLTFATLAIYRIVFLHFVRIPTGSMANTILPGDYLVVKKRAFGDINRGDLIIFRYPEDLSTYFLARVIGLSGETLQVRGGIVYIDDKPLIEQRVIVKPDDLFESDQLEELSVEGTGNYRVFYQAKNDSTPEDDNASGPFQIPENQYFVMGDNRDNSADSRYRGSVPRALIFGKPFMIYWSSRTDRQGDGQPRWERIFNPVK